jgi:Tol biopolymer transport system component
VKVVGAAALAALVLAGASADAAERAFPGGNGRIVFASNRAENLQAEIYAIGVDGTARRNLTRSVPTFDNAPVPSPDGSRILFRSSRDNFQGIWVMNADGGDQRVLAEGTSPTWSPDGTRIAFADTRGGIVVMDVAGGGRSRLVTGMLPVWSPDGANIAFLAGNAVRVVGSDGRSERRAAPGIVAGGVLTTGPAWSPDGSRIAFAGGPPDANNLASRVDVYVADAAGTGAVLLTDSGSSRAPAWSPDGRRLVFVHGPSSGGRAELSVVGADGSGLTALTRNDPLTYDIAPAWSPDGARIAFGRGRGLFASQVFVVNADGSGLRQVTRESPLAQFPEYEGPRWLPDGRTLVYTSWLPDNDFDLFTANPDGSGVRRLTDNAVQDSEPAWSPDGSRLAFVRRHASRPSGRSTFNDEVYVMRADGSGLRRLTRHGGEDTSPSWSPDGSRLVFARRTGNAGLDLYAMRADGGGLRRLTRLTSFLADPVWSPDGKTVLFGDADIGNGGRLFALDLRTARIRRLSPPQQTYARPDWSPRGERIAFVKVTHCGGSCQLTDAWVMRADGSGARELAKGAVHVAWSPDGGRLVLDSGTADVVRPDGSGRGHVTPETGAHDATPDWQPRCTRSGTARADRLLGGRAAELLCGLGGADLIRGGRGADRLFGAEGDDRIEARDGTFDVVGCGAGRDAVIADRGDLVGADCERVRRG